MSRCNALIRLLHILAMAALLTSGVAVSAEEEQPFPERVNEAIDRGVTWLLARPKLIKLEGTDIAHFGLTSSEVSYTGSDLQYMYPVGATALALYTLLKCGVDPDHAVIERGFAWLRKEHKIRKDLDGPASAVGWRTSYREGWSSYELSAQILALTARYDPRKKTKATLAARRKGKLKIKDRDDRRWLKELVVALIERRGVGEPGARDAAKRGWRYNIVPRLFHEDPTDIRGSPGEMIPPANQDLSSTQLAALALFSAHQFGERAEPRLWADIATFTLDTQQPEGPEHTRFDPGYHKGDYAAPTDRARGFAYIRGSKARHEGVASGAMTACGVANLVMAQKILGESAKGRALLRKAKLASLIERSIWDGLAWLDLHWSAFQNPAGGSYHIYYLYGLERAMDLLGKQLVGKHLWYREGAESILDRQRPASVKSALLSKQGAQPGVYWETKSTHKPYDVLDTCFALLFLRRATRTVAGVTSGK